MGQSHEISEKTIRKTASKMSQQDRTATKIIESMISRRFKMPPQMQTEIIDCMNQFATKQVQNAAAVLDLEITSLNLEKKLLSVTISEQDELIEGLRDEVFEKDNEVEFCIISKHNLEQRIKELEEERGIIKDRLENLFGHNLTKESVKVVGDMLSFLSQNKTEEKYK